VSARSPTAATHQAARGYQPFCAGRGDSSEKKRLLAIVLQIHRRYQLIVLLLAGTCDCHTHLLAGRISMELHPSALPALQVETLAAGKDQAYRSHEK